MNREPRTNGTYQEHISDETERAAEAPTEELRVEQELGKTATKGGEPGVELPDDHFDGMPSAD